MEPAPFEIIPMTRDNVDQAVRLERLCFSNPWSYDMLLGELENPAALCFLVCREGEALGYAGLHHILDEGYITNVAVSPRHRRQGLGRFMVEYLISWAMEQGLRFLTLEVRPSNLAAIGLYQEMGFQPVGTRKAYYTHPVEDALLMTLDLPKKPGG